MENKLKISPPWEVWASKLQELFAADPDVEVVKTLDGERKSVRLYVQSEDKADALAQLLPEKETFGGVEVSVKVLPGNEEEKPSAADLLRRAFAGNPALADVDEVPAGPGAPCLAYALFRPEVVQFWADNLGHPQGLVTTLFEDVATEVLTGPGAAGLVFATAPVA